MAWKSQITTLIARAFSLDKAENVKGFIVRCMVWILVVRALLTIIAIVVPDSKGYWTIIDVSIPSLSIGIPGNDAYFYWVIATQGFLPPTGYDWELINFSPLFPAILTFSKSIFQEYAPLVINTFFLLLTPLVLVKFLTKILKKDDVIKRVTILIMFNPIFMAYSISGLTEPLHFLLLFTALWAHYSKGYKYRILEYACIVLIILNRFIGIVLAGFYLFKAFLKKGLQVKERIKLCIPVALAGAVYFGWEFACKIVFGHTPSEARRVFWGHDFNFNVFTGDFLLQLPILLAGASLGVFTLKSYLSKDEKSRDLETLAFDRTEIHALLAFAAITLLFLGMMNKQISIVRYLGTIFPLFILMGTHQPSSKRLPFFSFAIIWGMVLSHLIAFPIISTTDPNLTITPVDTILFMSSTAAFLVVFLVYYLKRDRIVKYTPLLMIQVLLACLIVPLSIYYP
jgi:hypothetical protein